MNSCEMFAESAIEAWASPKSVSTKCRSVARSLVVSAASGVFRGSSRFVRCLYAHAVFPEQRHSFRAAIRWLKNYGEFITTNDLATIVRQSVQPNGRYFHLSFDDGFANVFEVGCEVLVEEKVPTTIFVPASFVEASPAALVSWFRNLPSYRKPLRVMTWNQIRQAAANGIEIGSHTMTHARLAHISGDASQLQKELTESKAVIEAATGLPCRAFAWPYGTMSDIDPTSFAAIKSSGYEIAFSAVRGSVNGETDGFCIPRHQIEFHWPASHIRLWARGFRE